MKADLFDTPDKIEHALASFKNLKENAGWQILEEIVRANMEILQEQIINGVENETKDNIDRRRDKLKAYKEVIDTPDFWIKKFEEPVPFIETSDPYHTIESLKKNRKDN
jgi:hypothetical protein